MFKSRRRSQPLKLTPNELDLAWFTGFSAQTREPLKRGERSTLSSLVHAVSDQDLRPALLSLTHHLGRVSTRTVASIQPYFPWVSYTEGWGESFFRGFCTSLALRSATDGTRFNLTQAAQDVTEKEAAAAHHFLDELLNASLPRFTEKEVEELLRLGLNPYTPERWPDLPGSYLDEVYRYDVDHRELQVSSLGNARVLIDLLSSEARTSPVWRFVRAYVSEWNARVEASLKVEPSASTLRFGVVPPSEVEDPILIGTFLEGALALEVSSELTRALESYQPSRAVNPCFRAIHILTTVVARPTETPVTVTFENKEEVVVKVDVCRDEFRQSLEMPVLVQIYLDRVTSALKHLPYLHPATTHALNIIKSS